MIGEMKHLLSRILKFKTKTQDDNTDLFVNVTFDCIDKPNECAKVSAATNLNKTKKHEYSREFVDSKCPHFNIAVILIVLLLAVVFVVVPLVYLLHCFDLLYTRWTTNEFTVFADHNRDSSHEQIHKHGIYVGKYRPENPAKETRSKSPILPRQRCTVVPDLEKFDCYPENGASENLCLKRGCCWYKEQTNTMKDTSSLGVPFCYYPKNYGGYQYLNISTASSGIIAFLERTFVSPYPNDASIIKLEVKYEQQQRLRIKVTDPNNVRFEPPYPEVPIVDHEKWPGSADYSVNIDKTKLGFQIIRKSDGLLIFDAMDVGGLVFADQFLQLSARLPSHRVYGLGEHTSPLQLSTNWTRFTMMNHDQIPSEDTNLYGSHPFYLVMEDSGKSHGVFLLNSNAMDVILQPTPAITFRTIGGVLDFFFFLGPSPADVVRQYTDVIGKPFMPPFWGLGFHLCRYGYKTINRTIEVWNRTRNAGIPLDVQWNDLDYMQHANDFTLNTTTFGGLPEFVQHLHKGGLPPWMITHHPNIKLRTSDQNYQSYVSRWFNKLMPLIQPYLYGNGGPVIMVQVENEYGSFGACDRNHTAWLRDLLLSYVGDDAVLFTTDGAGVGYLKCGAIDGVYSTVDFGTGANVSKAFAAMRTYSPRGPLVNSEFYPGWLTHWGEPLQTVSTRSAARDLDHVLAMNASVNIYLLHGGTNFGFLSGANYATKYQPQLTSYDYDAPLNEAGDPTEKYFALREVIGQYLPLPNMTLPEPAEKGDYGQVQLSPVASLLDPVILAAFSSENVTRQHPLTFEQLGHRYGFVLYQTRVPARAPDPAVLDLAEFSDRAYVFVNKELRGVLSRVDQITVLPLLVQEGDILQILVENQGRINYGSRLKDIKGLLSPNVTLGGHVLTDWMMTTLPFHTVAPVSELAGYEGHVTPPAFYVGHFVLPEGNSTLDTFLDTSGWTKGVAFVNDHNLGRYWPRLGPQVTLYVPATFLRPYPRSNTLVLLELEAPATNSSVALVAQPVLNGTVA